CCHGDVRDMMRSSQKVFLPHKLLECLPRLSSLPSDRLRWNTNEEIASYLISFDRHDEWLYCTLKTRPKNGSMILYNRKKVKYRKDGYCWKKRKDGKSTREDHMKLKVQGMEVSVLLPVAVSVLVSVPVLMLPVAVSVLVSVPVLMLLSLFWSQCLC
uniref:Calmodulin binding transcription activator 2 n=1 Tax=Cyclopterus lumpus TaxID=8103 RepID=A0A8C3AAG9_CYCLU